jgi:hypothetical protein
MPIERSRDCDHFSYGSVPQARPIQKGASRKIWRSWHLAEIWWLAPLLTEGGQVRAKSAGERGMAPLNQRLAVAEETTPEAMIYAHFNGVRPFI